MSILLHILDHRPAVAHLLREPAARRYEELVLALILEEPDLEKFRADPDYLQTSAFDDAISAELDDKRLGVWLTESIDVLTLLPAPVLNYLRKLESLIFALFFGSHGAAVSLLRSALETGEFKTKGFFYEFTEPGRTYKSLRVFYKDLFVHKSRFWKLATLRKIIR